MALYPDLRRYYNIDLVDVIEGRGPSPCFVIPLIASLPDTSTLAALQRGGMQFKGWGEDRQLLAALYNVLALNTEASGNWRKKPPEIPRWDAPKGERKKAPKQERKKLSVKDIHAMFNKKS